MGFFKRRKNAPLSISMYQGDNATPARSPPRRGTKYGVIPLTPDPVEDNPIAASSPSPTIPGEGAATNKKKKKNPNGFFKRKHNQRQSYVTITPDKKDEGSSSQAERAYAPQTSPREKTTSPTVVTPSKSFPVPSSSLHRTPPSTRSRGVHNNNNDDDENIPALVSPGKYEDLPPSPHNAIKRNLNSVFHENNTNDDEDNAISTGYNDNHHQTEENKKFLQRFRSSWKRSPLKPRQKQTEMRTFLEEHNNTIASTRNDPTDPPSPVPHTIDHSEEGSVPSLITEPDESKIAPMSNAADVARVSASGTAISSDDLVSHPSEQSKAGSSPSPRMPLTLGEKLWSLFQCGEDTTSDGYFSRIKCLELCAPMNGDRRGLRTGGMVDEEEEEEYAFVHQFIHELSKRGIKLIYHQAPQSDSSSDWTQLTVRLFLRPGQCHEREVHPPSLSWAILPVASRKVLTGSYDNVNESGEDTTLWTHLNLWDVYSVMAAEDDATVADEEDGMHSPARTKVTMSTTQSGFDSRDTTTRDTMSYTRYTLEEEDEEEERTVPSSGFFSITAGSSGNVYVFEASSGCRRDYVVMGLKKMIGWASRQVIMGKVDVCAELYGEDAAPMSGELPSLVTPSQALSRVTHAFLDEL